MNVKVNFPRRFRVKFLQFVSSCDKRIKGTLNAVIEYASRARRKEERTQSHFRACACDVRGRTLIEINLDIYSRRSAGYVGHCTSINAPTHLQLHPGTDITSELIICDRSAGARRRAFMFCAYVPWVDTKKYTAWRAARGTICESNNLSEFGEIKPGRAGARKNPEVYRAAFDTIRIFVLMLVSDFTARSVVFARSTTQGTRDARAVSSVASDYQVIKSRCDAVIFPSFRLVCCENPVLLISRMEHAGNKYRNLFLRDFLASFCACSISCQQLAPRVIFTPLNILTTFLSILFALHSSTFLKF